MVSMIFNPTSLIFPKITEASSPTPILIAFMMLRPISTISPGIEERVSRIFETTFLKSILPTSNLKSFLKSEMSLLKVLMSLSKIVVFLIELNTSFIFSEIFDKYGTILLNSPSKSRTESIQPLKLTIASPITAVTSRMFKLNIPRISVRILNAIFIGPPTTVSIISSAANRPLKVLVISSTLSAM